MSAVPAGTRRCACQAFTAYRQNLSAHGTEAVALRHPLVTDSPTPSWVRAKPVRRILWL